LRRFAVNIAFWALLREVHPAESAERLAVVERDFNKAVAELTGYGPEFGLGGENGGKHDHGFEVLVPTMSFAVKQMENVKGLRNVVRDAEDYVMHQALVFTADPDPVPTTAMVLGNVNKTWKFKVAMLQMEEDEAEEAGFPAMLSDDVADTVLVKTSMNATLDVQVDGQSLCTAEMVNGMCAFALKDVDWPAPGQHEVHVVCAETGNFCSVQFYVYAFRSELPAGSSKLKPLTAPVHHSKKNGASTEEEEDELDDDDEQDDEASDLDGFIVHDDVEGFVDDDDDDDVVEVLSSSSEEAEEENRRRRHRDHNGKSKKHSHRKDNASERNRPLAKPAASSSGEDELDVELVQPPKVEKSDKPKKKKLKYVDSD